MHTKWKRTPYRYWIGIEFFCICASTTHRKFICVRHWSVCDTAKWSYQNYFIGNFSSYIYYTVRGILVREWVQRTSNKQLAHQKNTLIIPQTTAKKYLTCIEGSVYRGDFNLFDSLRFDLNLWKHDTHHLRIAKNGFIFSTSLASTVYFEWLVGQLTLCSYSSVRIREQGVCLFKNDIGFWDFFGLNAFITTCAWSMHVCCKKRFSLLDALRLFTRRCVAYSVIWLAPRSKNCRQCK